jgi:hypothetical protein
LAALLFGSVEEVHAAVLRNGSGKKAVLQQPSVVHGGENLSATEAAGRLSSRPLPEDMAKPEPVESAVSVPNRGTAAGATVVVASEANGSHRQPAYVQAVPVVDPLLLQAAVDETLRSLSAKGLLLRSPLSFASGGIAVPPPIMAAPIAADKQQSDDDTGLYPTNPAANVRDDTGISGRSLPSWSSKHVHLTTQLTGSSRSSVQEQQQQQQQQQEAPPAPEGRPGGGGHGGDDETEWNEHEADKASRMNQRLTGIRYDRMGRDEINQLVITLIIVVALVLAMFGYFGTPTREHKAYRVENDDVEASNEDCPEGFHAEDCVDLIDRLGISALCLLDMQIKDGHNSWGGWVTLPVICVQCWCLQVPILYFLTQLLHERPHPTEDKHLPHLLVFIAIYVHFITVFGELALSLTLFRRLGDLTSTASTRLAVTLIFIVDSFILPSAAVIIGALYLCTSFTVADVILNSCAVAFITDIDNWILGANLRMNQMTGIAPNLKIVFPVNKDFIQWVNDVFILFPVVPVVYAVTLCHLGFDLLRL